MSEYLAAFLVLIGLVGIMLLMVPGMRRWGHVPKTTAGLAGVLSPDSVRGFPGGIVAALALIQGLGEFDSSPTAGYVIAALVCAVLANLRGLLAGIAFEVFGAIGILASVASLVRDGTCTGQSLASTFIGIAVLALCALLGAVGMLFTGRRPGISLLSMFAVIEVLAFLASPLGVSLLNLQQWQGWAVVGAAMVFGFLASIAPAMVVGLAAVAVGVTTLGMGALVGTACGTANGADGLIGLLVFVIAYVILRRFLRPRMRAWR